MAEKRSVATDGKGNYKKRFKKLRPRRVNKGRVKQKVFHSPYSAQ